MSEPIEDQGNPNSEYKKFRESIKAKLMPSRGSPKHPETPKPPESK